MKKTALYQYSHQSYDLNCEDIGVGKAPFSLASFEVPAAGRSRIHNHVENEVFVILKGNGVVRSGDSEAAVCEGESIQLTPFAEHTIVNGSATDPLRLLSLYWVGEAADSLERAKDSRPALIFSTPPTPNGDLHLGHLSGPYLAGDIARRALEQRGRASLHVTGRDDNQTYVANKAVASKMSCEEVCNVHADMIRSTLTKALVPLDGFITPDRDGRYARFVSRFVDRLYAAGHIFPKLAPALVGEDGAYLHEAYVRGTCPHCAADCDGNACEACGRPNQCVDLINPVDKRTGGKVRVVQIERLFFRFSAFTRQLDELIKQCRLPSKVFALAQGMLDDGLPDICVSHPSPWGMPIQIPGFTDHVLYVWFEMAAGYLFGAASVLEPGADPWEAAPRAFSGELEIIHAYGFDNAYYHALLFPAIYYALDLNLQPPKTHLVNELLDLDGQKFSTSRNHLIWGRDLLSQVPVDAVRFGLSLARPQTVRTDFSLARFQHDANAFFAETLGLWLAQAKELTAIAGATTPEPGAWLADQRAYYARIEQFTSVMERVLSMQDFAPHEAASELNVFAADSLRFARGQMWLQSSRGDSTSNYVRTAAALALLGLRAFATMGAPLMVTTAANIIDALGVSAEVDRAAEFLTPGSVVNWGSMPKFDRFAAATRSA